MEAGKGKNLKVSWKVGLHPIKDLEEEGMGPQTKNHMMALEAVKDKKTEP